MKKSSFLILFLFLLFHSSIKSQISESVSSNDTLKMFVKHYSNGQKMIEYYENSERQRDSLETKWFSNGNLRSKIYFVQNDVFGKVMEWYSNGQLKFEGERHQNEKTGICAVYFENGQLKYNRLFFRDYPIGKTIEYYANGNKHYQTNLKFIDNDKYIKNHHSRLVIDKLDTLTFKNIGQSISWYENGNKKERNFYSLIGIHNYNKTKKWHENNLIKQKGSFRQKRGVYKEWYINGQLKLKCKNRKYLLNGKSKF